MLSEAVDERTRLEGETEQLKTLLKREIDKFDTDMATKDNVIAEYKVICSNLSEKLEKTQQNLTHTSMNKDSVVQDIDSTDSTNTTNTSGNSAEERIKELELELAKTKLALVETECKNQDLTHQLSLIQPNDNQSTAPTIDNDRRSSLTRGGNKWLSKTLTSIRETAASAAASHSTGATSNSSGNLVRSATLASDQTLSSAPNTQMQKSTSAQVLKQDDR